MGKRPVVDLELEDEETMDEAAKTKSDVHGVSRESLLPEGHVTWHQTGRHQGAEAFKPITGSI